MNKLQYQINKKKEIIELLEREIVIIKNIDKEPQIPFKNHGVSCYLNSTLQLIFANNFFIKNYSKVVKYNTNTTILSKIKLHFLNELILAFANDFNYDILFILCILAFIINTKEQHVLYPQLVNYIAKVGRENFVLNKFINDNNIKIIINQEDAGSIVMDILSLFDKQLIILLFSDVFKWQNLIKIQDLINYNQDHTLMTGDNIFLQIPRIDDYNNKMNYSLTINPNLHATFNDKDYKLVAFIVHHGDSSGGHYIAYKIDYIPVNNKYIEFNDSIITSITKEQLLEHFKLAYILHFAKVDNRVKATMQFMQ